MIKLKNLLSENAQSNAMIKYLKNKRWKWAGSDSYGHEFDSPNGDLVIKIDDEGNWDGAEEGGEWDFGGFGLSSLKRVVG